MNDNERLEIIWCALNCMIDPNIIMRAIEKRTGKAALNKRWKSYFGDPEGTEHAIKLDLEKIGKKDK